MQATPFRPDARHFQLFFQTLFLTYGLWFLHWPATVGHYAISIFGCLLFTFLFESAKQKAWLPFTGAQSIRQWGLSVLISAASLCLLLKSGSPAVSLLAAFLTVASKYFFRIGSKHIFNPSAFGIIATIVLTQNAWLSPAQWGSNAVVFFSIITLGIIVVTRVQKLDVSLAFLFTFGGLLFWRQVLVLGWPVDYFVHTISTGSLLLFTFFMISDPRTSPNHPLARIVWAVAIGAVSFYLAAFKFMYNTPLWILVIAAPLVPVLDVLFKKQAFRWQASPFSFSWMQKPLIRNAAAGVLMVAMMTHEAAAFCGFYVSKADGTLKNKTSQVIVVRDGDKNVITMYNDFKGDFKDFAMVVPVPVVLQKKDIKVVDQQIFSTLNEYSKPRLVEYYDENPCNQYRYDSDKLYEVVVTAKGMQRSAPMTGAMSKVKIEAQYLVGEYDILILSATESTALRTWLNDNGYKLPAGANEVLEPYIKSNLKFFVVKVNEAEKKKLPGNFLRPLQISFSSPKFMLPIRLGMANADGDQDMLVYGFAKKGRIECANYRTVSLPTGKNVPLFVKDNFSPFYSNLFQHQWKGEGKAVAMLEYAWDVSPRNFMKCDPCIAAAPTQQDLVQAGVWWLPNNSSNYNGDDDASGSVYFTRLHLRYNRKAFPQDLQFQLTPNTENYQARYVVTHPATGDLSCEAGQQYLKDLKVRREDEMDMLSYLTGKGYTDWDIAVTNEEKALPTSASYTELAKNIGKESKPPVALYATIGLAGVALLFGLKKRKRLNATNMNKV